MKELLFFAFSILICSCNTNENEEKVIDLLISPESELTKISEIATNIEYIPLQTSESSIINYITDLKQTQNSLFVRSNTNEVFYFDNNGNYLFIIYTLG